ncbi:MAG: hypothetical protein AAF821_27450 [Cyanobacteria bacterium P01_D01_bin.156]
MNYQFMRQALMAGVLMGICVRCGHLIVQRMALLGDVVVPAVLPLCSLSSTMIKCGSLIR